MRYLATAAFLLGVVLLIAGADVYDRWGRETGVASLSDYRQDLRQRLTRLIPGAAAQPAPRQFLPAAPDGWIRRAWTVDDWASLPGFAGIEEEILATQLFEGVSGIELQVRGAHETLGRMRAATTWVYLNGDRLAEMTALKAPPPRGEGIIDKSRDMAEANMRMMATHTPFAVIKGVVWSRASNTLFMSAPKPEKVDWTLAAEVGDIHLYARAQRTTEVEMRSLLAAVDYDGLNALLAEPLAEVGSAAPALAAGEELAVAERTLKRRRVENSLAERRARLEAQEKAVKLLRGKKTVGGRRVEGLEEAEVKLRQQRADLVKAEAALLAADALDNGTTAVAANSAADADHDAGEKAEVTLRRQGKVIDTSRKAKQKGCGGTAFCSARTD